MQYATLSIPVERLEAIGQEVAQTGLKEWGIDDPVPRTVVLDYQWGDIETNIMVCRVAAVQFHVVFITRAELRTIAREKQ